ncbi:MAG: hypothetical protein JEZ08_16475 [Clostridiales bacterium]|nr:hypothetical protein [Clostridiales bacterium]
MYEIYVSDVRVYSDFVVMSPEKDNLVMINLLERSRSSVTSAVANIYRGAMLSARGVLPRTYAFGQYQGYIESFNIGKTKYHQSLVKSKLMYSKLSTVEEGKIQSILVQNENQEIKDILFDALYDLHDLPLMSEWKDYILYQLKGDCLKRCRIYKADDYSYVVKEGSITTDLNNWEFFELNITTDELDKIITSGLQSGMIKVADLPQKKIEVTSLDDYFQIYGPKVIENVMKGIKPQLPRISELDFKFKNKMPFPVQAEVINGLHNYLKKENTAILVGQMGTGKTFMSSGLVSKGPKDSRTLVMGPSIMLEKWKEEIESEVPYSRATIIDSFESVVELGKKKGTKPNGREFYITSKDFLKLSYESIPVVYKEGRKSIPLKKCRSCDTIYYDSHDHDTCGCGSIEFRFIRSRYKVDGAKCTECGEIVYKSNARIASQSHRDENDTQPTSITDFSQPSNKNSMCHHCGNKLWQPNVTNLTLDNEYAKSQEKSSRWMKIKVARNKAKKSHITKYILKEEYESLLQAGFYNEENHSIVRFQKSRKYSPALYMNKVLGKDFFSYGIYDEVHQLKGGGSAQGNAFAKMLKTTKKSVVMTGTIAGGVAVDLFYILFRCFPKLMLENGYGYDDSMKFAADYGVLEETRVYEDQEVYFNRTSAGRQVGTKKIKPGISPLLFSEFLINNTIFVDLSDFEAFMVELTEIPVEVPMEKKQTKLYKQVQDVLKEQVRQKGGKKLLGQVLPTLMSLADTNKLNDIIHPEYGDLLYSFKEEKEYYLGEDGLLNKERELLKIVEQELSEGRNVFIYNEFTSDGDKNVTERLKSIIEDRLNIKGQVDILKASSPSARKRMSWIKEKADQGTRVVITNPKCVEVGLDFIFKHKGRVHNFPTIVFYQVGYNLATVWQASSRHLRLIQSEPCRTYYMFYRDTLQETAIQILSSKKSATSALQGSFSHEGLVAMSNSVDPRVLLADALMKGSQSKDIEKMFDKINNRDKVKLNETDRQLMEKILAGFRGDAEMPIVSNDIDLPGTQLSLDDLTNDFIEMFKMQENSKTIGSGKKTVVKGQLALF